ncbi:hypothetical protein DMB68_05430 [Flavobacterium hydrophilum]|uniref:Uncharacterized protein n=1 Tax=Flavobacterium hydrophilum TaxID=2211445 RepID=A0A2V4C6I9_9FLAO|nr:hypothetical protein DMB68_05430 [Flavobacterium hydrophilum]
MLKIYLIDFQLINCFLLELIRRKNLIYRKLAGYSRMVLKNYPDNFSSTNLLTTNYEKTNTF